MVVFDRWTPTMRRSFALLAFNSCETAINEHFWSFKVISDYARYIARDAQRGNSNSLTAEVFHARGNDARRIPPTTTDWLNARQELENWLRLSAIVSAAAYHEAYLRQIVRSALMSNPMVRFNHSKSIDGTTWLKMGLEIPFDVEATAVTKGDWNTRKTNFTKLFGTVSDADKAFPVGDLETIRRARNDYAHGFGRGLEVPEPSERYPRAVLRITQTKFISLIGKISKSAQAIDRHMLNNVIGDFELINAFHHWPDRGIIDPSGQSEIRRFQKYIHGQLGISRNLNYCQDLIGHYQNA